MSSVPKSDVTKAHNVEDRDKFWSANEANVIPVNADDGYPESKESFLRSLSPWSGRRFSNEGLLNVAKRPFTISLSPIVLWGSLVYGTTNAWRQSISQSYFIHLCTKKLCSTVVALSVCVSLLFSDPQFGYGFGAGPVGLISGIGPFISSFIANVLAGPMSDWAVRWLSRHNGGIYEPECVLSLVRVKPLSQ